MVKNVKKTAVMFLRNGDQIIFNGSVSDVLGVRTVSRVNDPKEERALLSILGLESDSHVVEINCHESTEFDKITK